MKQIEKEVNDAIADAKVDSHATDTFSYASLALSSFSRESQSYLQMYIPVASVL